MGVASKPMQLSHAVSYRLKQLKYSTGTIQKLGFRIIVDEKVEGTMKVFFFLVGNISGACAE